MPFTYPEDMTLHSYEMYRPARPDPGHDPLRQGGELPPPGHSQDEEDKIESTCPILNSSHNALSL